jgi:hypothetical protein
MLQPDNTTAKTPPPSAYTNASAAIPTPDPRKALEARFDNTPTHIRGMAVLIIVSFIFMFAMQTSLMYEIKSPRLFYRGNILRGGHNIDRYYSETWPKTEEEEEEDGDSDGRPHYKKLALHGQNNDDGVNNLLKLGHTTTTAHRVLFGEDNNHNHDDSSSGSNHKADFRPFDLAASASAVDPSYADGQADADQRDACCGGDTAIHNASLDNDGYEKDSSYYYNDEDSNDDYYHNYQILLHNKGNNPSPSPDDNANNNDHHTVSNDDHNHYYSDYYSNDNSDWPSGFDSHNNDDDGKKEAPLVVI